jgi:hypothetical protein
MDPDAAYFEAKCWDALGAKAESATLAFKKMLVEMGIDAIDRAEWLERFRLHLCDSPVAGDSGCSEGWMD